MSKNSETLPPHYRWNFAILMLEFISFGVGFGFYSPTSVLPAFARQLTDSAPVIGLVGTIFSGGWMIPQLLTARLINDKPHKKPYIYIGILGRVMLWVIALALWAGLARFPTAMLILFYVCLTLFAVADGVASVPWFDIMARTIPMRRRGRLIGTAQSISGLAGIGVGALVALILNRRPFPTNYLLLFVLASVTLIPSSIGITLLREPEPVTTGRQMKKQTKGDWWRPLIVDPALRRLMICRILFGALGMATPFYVLHAADELHLPEGIIGGFVMAQALAGVASSALMGLVSERWGPRYVIRIGTAASVTGPLFALVVHLVGGAWLVQAYPLVYVGLGVMNSTIMLGFSNYLMEIAPDANRPSYIGLCNTIVGVTAVAPTLGGWLLASTSYTTLFGLTALIVAIGFLLSLGLKPAQASTAGGARS